MKLFATVVILPDFQFYCVSATTADLYVAMMFEEDIVVVVVSKKNPSPEIHKLCQGSNLRFNN